MAKKIENFGVDRKMLHRMTWKSTFANYISKLIDYPMTEEHVYSDENIRGEIVTPKSLLLNHPLLLVMNHNDSIMAIIPYKDYISLENGEIHPLAYIAGAHWNYGKYSGGKDVRNSIFWKPLENREGICNTEKINEYLSQIGKIEIHSEDYRQKLFDAMESRIREELKINVSNFMSYDGENALLIANPNKRNTVTCYLPAILLNCILYHPGEREWEMFASGFEFELGVNNNQKKRYIVPDKSGVDSAEFCRKVWRNFGLTNYGYTNEPINQEYEPKEQHHKHNGNGTFFGFVKKFFGK